MKIKKDSCLCHQHLHVQLVVTSYGINFHLHFPFPSVLLFNSFIVEFLFHTPFVPFRVLMLIKLSCFRLQGQRKICNTLTSLGLHVNPGGQEHKPRSTQLPDLVQFGKKY